MKILKTGVGSRKLNGISDFSPALGTGLQALLENMKGIILELDKQIGEAKREVWTYFGLRFVRPFIVAAVAILAALVAVKPAKRSHRGKRPLILMMLRRDESTAAFWISAAFFCKTRDPKRNGKT